MTDLRISLLPTRIDSLIHKKTSLRGSVVIEQDRHPFPLKIHALLGSELSLYFLEELVVKDISHGVFLFDVAPLPYVLIALLNPLPQPDIVGESIFEARHSLDLELENVLELI